MILAKFIKKMSFINTFLYHLESLTKIRWRSHTIETSLSHIFFLITKVSFVQIRKKFCNSQFFYITLIFKSSHLNSYLIHFEKKKTKILRSTSSCEWITLWYNVFIFWHFSCEIFVGNNNQNIVKSLGKFEWDEEKRIFYSMKIVCAVDDLKNNS